MLLETIFRDESSCGEPVGEGLGDWLGVFDVSTMTTGCVGAPLTVGLTVGVEIFQSRGKICVPLKKLSAAKLAEISAAHPARMSILLEIPEG